MEILADLDDLTIVRATREHLVAIDRLLADDPTSPRYVATTTLISDDLLGPAVEDHELEEAFARIDADPNQVLAVVLDDTEHVVGTFQLTFVTTLARGGAVRAVVSEARLVAGPQSIAIGRRVFAWIIEASRRAQARVLVVVSDKQRAHIHGFFTTMGFRLSHDGLTLPLW